MITTNLFVIANIKQLRTGGSFGMLLPFFRTSWSVGFLNSAIFNSFHNRVEFGTILEGLRNFREGGFTHPNPLGTPLLLTNQIYEHPTPLGTPLLLTNQIYEHPNPPRYATVTNQPIL